jgi:hypothetical protein
VDGYGPEATRSVKEDSKRALNHKRITYFMGDVSERDKRSIKLRRDRWQLQILQ